MWSKVFLGVLLWGSPQHTIIQQKTDSLSTADGCPFLLDRVFARERIKIMQNGSFKAEWSRKQEIIML